MNYGQQCGNKFNARVEVGAFTTDTVWLDLQWIDNRLQSWKNGRELFTITANGAPPDNRHAFTIFDGVPGPNPLTYVAFAGFNEPKASPYNPWRFRWRLSRVNQAGTEVWAEAFEIGCSDDQGGGWDKRVFEWQMVIRWLRSGAYELSPEEAKQYDEGFRILG